MKKPQLMSRFDSPKGFKWFEGNWSERLMQAALYLLVTFLLGLLFFGRATAHAEPAPTMPEGQIVAAIMGEARGGGARWDDWVGKRQAMLAIAEAIRNRGTLNGVYGKDFVNRDPEWVQRKCEALARAAWKDSARSRLVGGAQFWASLKVDAAWIEKMERAGFKRTAVIGGNAFYLNPKKGAKSKSK